MTDQANRPVTPETLTLEMIESWQRSVILSRGITSREADEACRDAEWAIGGRGPIALKGAIVREARQRICDAINATARKP